MQENLFQQAPVRNESVVGAQVYGHSGEFSPRVVDFELPGRGVSFQFVRKYRCVRSREAGSLGRGWTFAYAKRIERVDGGLLYYDGLGRTHRFARTPGRNDWVSPDGFYAVLAAENGKILLKQRFGGVFVFEEPGTGGRLLAIEDRNGNALEFGYAKEAIHAVDSLGRRITIALDRGRVVGVRDHAGRAWRYEYDRNGCLTEVIQPPTDRFPDGPRIRYGYDEGFRLASITDPNGRTFLRNFYDDQGRVARQEHGEGAFGFRYETIGETKTGPPIYRTHVRRKNGARLLLTHDAYGHVVERTLFVAAGSLSPEDRGGSAGATVPLTSRSRFNRPGELVERVHPAGNAAEWTYDENNNDPRARGNLLRVVRKPAPGVESDQEQITTRYAYEPRFQRRRSITDPRGHTVGFEYDDRGNPTRKTYPEVTGSARAKRLDERFEYNAAGQLIRVTDARGATTRYHYYPAEDPTGAKGREGVQSDAQKAGGYLARVVRDPASNDRRLKGRPAHLVTEFGYDALGNITTIRDGKGNPTRFKYDTHDNLVRITSREPFEHEAAIRHDANGNPIETTLSFDRHEYDPIKRDVARTASTIRQGLEYNALDNVTRRALAADGREITETLARDADENIVRRVRPLGNVAEYRFDERDLLLERRLGVGTKEETTVRYTYTPNGRPGSMTDGRGETTRYHFDGFHRYQGFTNAGGAAKRQSFDEAGNVTRIEVTGDAGLVNERGEPDEAKARSLLEIFYKYDELNRRVRGDRAWRDPATGEALGTSRLNREEAVVSTFVEFGDNHRPSRVFYETGNVLSLEYDGADRVVAASDATGESVSFEYDENGNPVRIERLGPEADRKEERVHDVIVQRFDELDRPVARSVNLEPPESLAYNALGLVTTYRNQANVETRYLHDSFGRWVGAASTAIIPHSLEREQRKQLLLERIELDDDDRIVARINAAGHRTRYRYDGLDRRSAVIYPDGTTRHFERDGNGNVVRIVDQNRNIIVRRFDPLNRLLERRIKRRDRGETRVERFRYDGLNRIVAAATGGSTIVRRYDSLSRPLAESQDGRTVRRRYDAAGNCTHLIYPGGHEVRKLYDRLGRVSEVRDGRDGLVAEYAYRASDQLERQKIGEVLEAAFAYKACQSCLSEIVYRSTRDGRIIEGSRYLYDAVGNRTQEFQLHRGDDFGERYFYDSANRLIGVRYGVEKLEDPGSEFAEEVEYDLGPAGTWRHRTIHDANGRTVAEIKGVTNRRDAYLTLGKRRFEYDANGNRILETNSDDADCAEKRYTYDHANRLVRVECLDARGKTVRTIEYTYDAFGRQVLKRVADADGTQEHARVWSGRQLIEEYEDGKLSKSFVYGARVNEPVKTDRHGSGGTQELFYTFDGRGYVTGLVDSLANVTERYRYDVFGQPFLSEVDGQPVEEDEQRSTSSPAGNPFFAGAQVWDSDTGLLFALETAFDPTTGQTVNPEAGPEELDQQEKSDGVDSLNEVAVSSLAPPAVDPFDPNSGSQESGRGKQAETPFPPLIDQTPEGEDSPRKDLERELRRLLDSLPPEEIPPMPPELEEKPPTEIFIEDLPPGYEIASLWPETPVIAGDQPTDVSGSGGSGGGTEGGNDGAGSSGSGAGEGDSGSGDGGGTVEAMPGSDVVTGSGPRGGVGPRGGARAVPGSLWGDPRGRWWTDPADPQNEYGGIVYGERRRGPIIVDPGPGQIAVGKAGGWGGTTAISWANLRLGGVIDPAENPGVIVPGGEPRRGPAQPDADFPGRGGGACETGDCSPF